mmetsp:Transcript_10023/g.18846  ORF Transcript_10023/g.18846 Transcript_10023/m.18846 type:complete len:247 (+) Transcript_10023:574-1314(+)
MANRVRPGSAPTLGAGFLPRGPNVGCLCGCHRYRNRRGGSALLSSLCPAPVCFVSLHRLEGLPRLLGESRVPLVVQVRQAQRVQVHLHLRVGLGASGQHHVAHLFLIFGVVLMAGSPRDWGLGRDHHAGGAAARRLLPVGKHVAPAEHGVPNMGPGRVYQLVQRVFGLCRFLCVEGVRFCRSCGAYGRRYARHAVIFRYIREFLRIRFDAKSTNNVLRFEVPFPQLRCFLFFVACSEAAKQLKHDI